MECAFTSPMRTQCSMFVMCYMQCCISVSTVCSGWMCCPEEVYIYVWNCDVFSVVSVYLDHLKFCVVCINGQRYVGCSECNVVSDGCYVLPTLPCATCRNPRWLCNLGVFALRVILVS